VGHRTESEVCLFVSFELGEKEWKIAWATSLGEKPRLRTFRARDTKRLLEEIEKARVAGRARRVLSCYEAGRDGFWLHRFLRAHGIENRIVDSASIEVNRRRGDRRPIAWTPRSCSPCCCARRSARRTSGAS
jgi:transposase